MKNNLKKLMLVTCIFMFAFSITSFAGTWSQTGNDWKYQNDNGTFASNTWITENGAEYYLGADGIMLKNTLSPDGYPIGRDGKKLSDNEMLPDVFPGSKAEFLASYDALMNFWQGYEAQFNQVYDEVYPVALGTFTNRNYEEGRAAISRLDSFDFTPYLSSEHAIVRKAAITSETLRIEQVYYLSQFVSLSEHQDFKLVESLYDAVLLSLDRYHNNMTSVLNKMSAWDIY